MMGFINGDFYHLIFFFLLFYYIDRRLCERNRKKFLALNHIRKNGEGSLFPCRLLFFFSFARMTASSLFLCSNNLLWARSNYVYYNIYMYVLYLYIYKPVYIYIYIYCLWCMWSLRWKTHGR